MNAFIKVSDVWKATKSLYYKQNGVWLDIQRATIKKGGVWVAYIRKWLKLNQRGSTLTGVGWFYGYNSVSIRGGTIAVGIPVNSNSNAGSVETYLISGNNLIARPTLTSNKEGTLYGTSVDICGDWLAVGAPAGLIGSPQSAVWVYYYNGSSWSFYGQILGAWGSNAGLCISLGDGAQRVAVGSYGYVSVYDYAYNGTYVKVGVDITETYSSGSYGFTVRIASAASNRIVVGDQSAVINGVACGFVRVYEETSGVWAQLASTNLNGAVDGDHFGRSVDINALGTMIVVGGNNYVKVYGYTAGAWSQLGQTLTGKTVGENFGCSVAMNESGSRVIIGANGKTNSASQTIGCVRIYNWDGTSWSKIAQDIDGLADQGFGQYLSIDEVGDQVITAGSLYSWYANVNYLTY